MTLCGILSDSRKHNLPSVDPSLTRSLAGVKHTTQTMPETPQVPNCDPTCLADEPLPEPPALADILDPMRSLVYLSSPLDTILESMHDPNLRYVSLHDLIEAYSVLSERIRSQLRVIIHATHPLPALAPLEEHASVLARALTRDIRRALIDPSKLRETPPSGESSFTNAPMTDHEIQYALDLAVLCHHALRFVSDVFAFKPLYSLFSEQDLQDLLSHLLKVALATSLSTPHASKTWSLVFWTIQIQNLPSTVLALNRIEIVTALRQSICDGKGLQAKLDGLKAVHNLLKQHEREFISPLLELLPLVLENLTSESIECRLQAGYALGGFVLAKMNMISTADYPHEPVVRMLRSYIDEQYMKQHSSQTMHLPGLVAGAFSAVSSSMTTVPSWAVVVLASLVVLSDASVFFHDRSIRFTILSLRYASNHKQQEIRTAHATVWRTLVWAFSRLSSELIAQRRSAGGKLGDLDVTRENVYKTIKQELKGGIGIALVTLLLESSDVEAPTDVSRALLIIRDMVAGENHTDPREAILLLNRIVSAIGTPLTTTAHDDDWHVNIDVSRGLFDGTIIDASLGNLQIALSSLGDVKVDRVRQLSETELVHHWDSLISIWIKGVEKSLQAPSLASSGELLHSWQSLLLVQAHLTQEHSHLTASSAFAQKIASIVARFLVQLEDPKVQLRYIQFVHKLWGVMTNVFSSSWLAPPAEIILAAVLQRNFTLIDEDVKVAWSQLCAELISVGIPTLLHIVNVRSGYTEGLQVTRQLWMVLAKAVQDPDDYVDWDDVICFLVIPFKAWTMSDAELLVWGFTLQKAISMAGATSIKSSAVIQRMLKRMNEEETAKLMSFPKGLAVLLSHLDVSDVDDLPIDIFSMVDTALVSAYPPPAELLATCIDVLRLIGQIIHSTPVSMLVQLVTTIGKSLRLWIGDEKEVMLESEYNAVLTGVYCRTLGCLRRLEPSLERLIAISPFLATAFVRVPHPAIGPLAFENFWRETYHDLSQYRPFYPDCLKSCLMGFADVYGGSLGEDLSMGTETQMTQMSTVPDSQPFHNYEVGETQRFEADVSRYSSFNTTMIYDRTLPGGSVPERHLAATTPAESHFHPSLDAKERIQHSHGHMAVLQQLNDYNSLNDHDSYLNKESSRSKHSAHQETPRSSPRLLTSTIRRQEEQSSSAALGLSLSSRPNPRDAAHLVQSPHRKRPSDSSADRQRAKRRKTGTEIHLERSPMRNFRKTQSEGDLEPCSSLVGLESVSPSPMNSSETEHAVSRRMVSHWVKGQSSPDSPRDAPRDAFEPDLHSEDYNSWEAGVSVEEMRNLQREFVGYDVEIPEDDDRSELNEDLNLPKAIHDTTIFDPLPRSSAIPKQTRPRTAPGSIPPRPPRPPPLLRRHQTTSTSTRIEALQRAYTAIVNDDDESQVAMEDLVQATALVNRIGTTLNEQIGKRLKVASESEREDDR